MTRKTSIEEVTEKVKLFYANKPYPGLGNRLMINGQKRLAKYFTKPGKILFPGCGTGHGLVAMAKLRKDFECYGLDLSRPSLDIAKQLAQLYKVSVHFKEWDYMKPLPWHFKFKYITLQGTLHHAADPSIALLNLVNYLEDDGLIHINLYGSKYHQRRFEIIELLDLLQEGKTDLQEKFSLFKSMQDQNNKISIKNFIMGFSLRFIWRWFYQNVTQIKSHILKETEAVPWTSDFKKLNQLWIDQYNNPNEKLYDILETKHLLESANLEVVEMLSLGKIRINDLPKRWLPLFNKLDKWSQYRVMELYYKNTGSVNLIARKKR